MFERLKRLWHLSDDPTQSAHTIEMNPEPEVKRMAIIVGDKYDPLAEFPDETDKQPPQD